MRKKVLSISMGLFMFLVMAAPVFANSSTFSWTLNERIVSGATTGTTHGLDKGLLKISGSITTTQKLVGAVGPNAVHVSVYTKSGKLIGSIDPVNPSTSVGGYVSFAKSLGSVEANTFYIEAWRTEKDGYNLKGSGYITTE